MTFFMHERRYRDLGPAEGRLITVCGAGALGANLAESLARMGLGPLRVIDRDRVEAHNLSTQPWAQQDVGAPKACALAAALYRAVGARVDAQHVELTPERAPRLLAGSAVVVDAFDNVPSRAAVARAAVETGAPRLHLALAASGDYGCGLWDDAYVLPATPAPGGDTCDYPLTRPLALLVAAAAAEALAAHMLTGARQGFEVTLRDLRVTPAGGA